MNRRYFIGLITVLLTFSISSCGDKKKSEEKEVPKLTKTEMKASLTEIEDSLRMMQKEGVKIESLHRIEYINRHLAYYRSFPDDEYAPVCLDKVQWMYLNLNALQYSVDYADSILEKYPKYENRASVLEAQGSTYDVMIQPRDSAMVRKYYTMLLDENPNMEKEKSDMLRKRLKNNNLSFDEWIMVNN